jgi:hypothetical protein
LLRASTSPTSCRQMSSTRCELAPWLTLMCLSLANCAACCSVDAVSHTQGASQHAYRRAPAGNWFICLLSVLQLLRSGPDSPLHPAPLWARPGLAGGRCCDAALVREFRREAGVVRGGMEGDLIKVRQLAGLSRPTYTAGWVCWLFLRLIVLLLLTERTACECMSLVQH